MSSAQEDRDAVRRELSRRIAPHEVAQERAKAELAKFFADVERRRAEEEAKPWFFGRLRRLGASPTGHYTANHLRAVFHP